MIETDPGAMIGSGLTVRFNSLISFVSIPQFSHDISAITIV